MFPDGVGSQFHQPGTVNENVLKSDFHLLISGFWGDVDM